MIPDNLPYQEIGIDKAAGERVSREIGRLAKEYPGKSINVQQVSELSGLPGNTVKQVFYLLLGLRLLKATFFPRHRACGRPIGEEETSVEKIKENANQGEYGSYCVFCGGPVESEEDIVIQIVFWEPGVDVGR
jgi:hypothetical protein